MNRKYYDPNRLQAIEKIMENHQLYYGINEIQKYLEIYPNDFKANIDYIYALMGLGLFDEAQNIIDNLVIDGHFRSDYYARYLNKVKLYLLCYQHKFDECYSLLQENIKILKDTHLKDYGISIYLRKKLGILTANDYSEKTYMANQIINYSEKEAINHIISRHCYSCDVDTTSKLFQSSFPLENTYYQLRNLLPTSNRLYAKGIQNNYLCKYDNNGILDGKTVDYFWVCVIDDTNDIITMYPCNEIAKMPYLDLNPIVEDCKSPTKRISQIDKFNQRYGKMFDKK